MKRSLPDPILISLLCLIGLLLIVVAVLLGNGGSAATTQIETDASPVPLANGSFNQAGDIQGAATGLQNAAPVAPSQLNQLQVSR